MPAFSHNAKFTASEIFAGRLKHPHGQVIKMRVVIGGGPRVVQWHLKEWRLHRNLRQARLAEMMATSVSVISDQETGKKRLNDDWIDKWATAIGVRPIDLMRPPGQADVDLPPPPDDVLLRRALELFQSIDAQQQSNVLSIMESLSKRVPEGS
jgi:transcriptional regulator with XRE-family HTH domain